MFHITLAGALLCSLLTTITTNAASIPTPKVVSMPIRRATDADVEKFRKRNHVTSDIWNDIQDVPSRYLMSCSVGNPWQSIDLWIDTGSSDTWMFTPDACITAGCIDGSFDSTQSTTFNNLSIPLKDCLGPGCVDGWYFKDGFGLGGIGISEFQMGLADSAPNYAYGIMGVNGNQGQKYRILPQHLADQGWTQTAAFSIYMDDISASHGQMLFGGYDTEKFHAPLKVFPWDLAWTGLKLKNHHTNQTTHYISAAFPSQAIIDTGSDKAQIPPDIYFDIATYFNVTCSGQLLCASVADLPGAVVFQIGGDEGLEMHMPFSQLAKPRLVDGKLPVDGEGRELCDFTLGQGGMGANVLGDPFLRNTYTIWDSDRKQIGMAQAKFGVPDEESCVVEITPSGNLASAQDPTSIAFAKATSVASGWCGR